MYVNIYIHLCADTIFNDRQKNSCLQTAYLVVKGKNSQELTYLSELYPGSLVLKLPAVLKTAGETQGATAVSL